MNVTVTYTPRQAQAVLSALVLLDAELGDVGMHDDVRPDVLERATDRHVRAMCAANVSLY